MSGLSPPPSVSGMAPDVLAAMSQPEFYPGARGDVVIRETLISWVFLAGPRAYKLKKPVTLPYLDHSTPERRRRACEDEVRLNRRLAPERYLGVRAIVPAGAGYALAGADAPAAVDYVVEMTRFDERRTLAAAIAARRVHPADIVQLAATLARFHAHARPASPADAVGDVERVAAGNFGVLDDRRDGLDVTRLDAAERFVASGLRDWADVIGARACEGHVRDGHGDLRAEHVLLGDPLEIVDCVEFDDALRTIDVGADLAFLVMDLTRLGRQDLAWELVGAYRRAGGDPGPDALVAFHASMRAHVRAKVAVLGGKLEEARGLLVIGDRLAWRARLPLVLVVCGVPASGKSHLAAALAGHSGLPIVSSDVTRKELAGVELDEPAPPSAYGREMTRRTYTELGARAVEELNRTGGVIVDATFRRAEDRHEFAGALGGKARPVYVECRAPPDVLAVRALVRAAAGPGPSDAGVAEVARLAAEWEPLTEVPRFSVDTDRPPADVLDEVTAGLDRHDAACATAS